MPFDETEGASRVRVCAGRMGSGYLGRGREEEGEKKSERGAHSKERAWMCVNARWLEYRS
jgi:hypothetical protein